MRKRKDNNDNDNNIHINNSRNTNSHSKNDSILTRHEIKLAEFKNRDARLNKIKTSIEKLKKEITVLKKDRAYKELNNENFADILVKISDSEKQIIELQDKMEYVSSGKDEIDYLLESSDTIMEYMVLEAQEAELLSLKSLNQEQSEKLNDISNKKNDLSESYLLKFDSNYVSRRNLFIQSNVTCEHCGEYLEEDSCFLVCPNCAICKPTISNAKELSYKEMQDYDYRPQFTYDKSSHLEDWLRRFQSKENRDIPQDVLDKVILEAQKERIKDLNLLTEDKVKKYLKKIGLNEYYDNVIHIINRINGRPKFTLTPELEEKIKTMFRQIQEPFERHKPSSRRNFLSYSYCLHKFFQILGLDEFARYFPLLKSTDKLRQQDQIFKKIVMEMAEKDKTIRWVFYPSI